MKKILILILLLGSFVLMSKLEPEGPKVRKQEKELAYKNYEAVTGDTLPWRKK